MAIWRQSNFSSPSGNSRYCIPKKLHGAHVSRERSKHVTLHMTQYEVAFRFRKVGDGSFRVQLSLYRWRINKTIFIFSPCGVEISTPKKQNQTGFSTLAMFAHVCISSCGHFVMRFSRMPLSLSVCTHLQRRHVGAISGEQPRGRHSDRKRD